MSWVGLMDDNSIVKCFVGDDMQGLPDTPSSHRLASSLGVNAHSMQVMKASFFGDEDEQDDLKGKHVYRLRISQILCSFWAS